LLSWNEQCNKIIGGLIISKRHIIKTLQGVSVLLMIISLVINNTVEKSNNIIMGMIFIVIFLVLLQILLERKYK
jgi:hypothetical protein